ncbi:acyltransferase [Opitutaceae bacterium]
MAVAVAHWVTPYPFGLPAGTIGVSLFFVISGYLITGNLLEAAAAGGSPWTKLGNFYGRRILRIFPLYYAAILGAALAGIPPFRDTLGTTLSYLTNGHLFVRGEWHGYISHLWSLSVEQHFYLFWPLVVLFVPASRMAALTIGLVLFAPIFRVAASVVFPETHPHLISILTPACFDSLGIGAFIALLRSARENTASTDRAIRLALVCGLTAFAVIWSLHAGGIQTRLMDLLYPTTLCLVFGWLVDRGARGFSGRFGATLQSPLLVYLGTISYGIYVFHYLTPWVVYYLLSRLGYGATQIQTLMDSTVIYTVVLTAITVLAASVSWHALERPLNALKRYFPRPDNGPPSPVTFNSKQTPVTS